MPEAYLLAGALEETSVTLLKHLALLAVLVTAVAAELLMGVHLPFFLIQTIYERIYQRI